MQNKTIFWGAVLMGTAIALGAFGAHALKTSFLSNGEEIWKTAVLYQMVHGLALLALSNYLKAGVKTHLSILVFFILGAILFSGSLYVLAIVPSQMIRSIAGPMTPIGGLCFILGWLLVIRSVVKKN